MQSDYDKAADAVLLKALKDANKYDETPVENRHSIAGEATLLEVEDAFRRYPWAKVIKVFGKTIYWREETLAAMSKRQAEEAAARAAKKSA